MFYTIYSEEFGHITLHMYTIHISGFHTYITGYDEDKKPVNFVMDKLCYLDDYITDYGYCHIISYTKDGVCTKCNLYQSLS